MVDGPGILAGPDMIRMIGGPEIGDPSIVDRAHRRCSAPRERSGGESSRKRRDSTLRTISDKK